MKNWEDFDWTDEDGDSLQSKFIYAAVDSDGCAFCFDVAPPKDEEGWISLRKSDYCGKFKVENWEESLIHRKDCKKFSAFTEENFLEFMNNSGEIFHSCNAVYSKFNQFLESRKPLQQEVTDAMAILEKHGYKFTKG